MSNVIYICSHLCLNYYVLNISDELSQVINVGDLLTLDTNNKSTKKLEFEIINMHEAKIHIFLTLF